ncbi:hypothetical protein AMTRI_Chr09g13880 [Amborella trichopoda]|uniref:RING-type domain-containing protein n=1 Tax=Amborella trichopoda TaxID=13333 RepID=U5CUY3_AMBTC|nr:RING-H2 finger protein ATL80 [Amborella trichopoda]ERN17116.1 hypothetical protein AMTR_s00044p00112360 [Amborella trichopoda]|eukprot:XP_006855649.1 RING-H2 finger protein ATL80 [Amborella trichopoda]
MIRRLLREPSLAQPPEPAVDSDVVVVLAALLCTLICVVGLGFMARCAWRCRSPGAEAGIRRPENSAKGLKKKALQSLPRHVYGQDSEAGKSSDCAICLTEFVDGDDLRVLPGCGHGFHVKCIDTWLSSRSSCPSCRLILRPGTAGRCQLCGGATATSSAGVDGGDPGLKAGEDDANRFLP